MLLRFFSLTLVFLTTGYITFSQEVYLGLKGGYSISNISSDGGNDISLKRLHGPQFGFVVSGKRTNFPVGLSIEPGYILKGTKTNLDSVNYRFHFINSPILIDYYPIEKLKFSIGPEVSYLAKAKNILNDSTSTKLIDYDKKWEFSGALGVSYSVSFFMDLGFRFNTAFTQSSDFDAVLNRRKIRNRYMQFFVLLKIAN